MPGLLVTRGRRVLSLIAFTIVGGRIVAMDILADPDRLQRLDLSDRRGSPS